MAKNNSSEVVALDVDGAAFKKLVVPAHAAALKNAAETLLQHMLIVRRGDWIVSYGTDLYQLYRTSVEYEKGKAEASAGFRVCLFAEDMIEIAKRVKDDARVIVTYTPGESQATCRIVRDGAGVKIPEEQTVPVPVFVENDKHFPDIEMEPQFAKALEEDPVPGKAFKYSYLENMGKAIKTAVPSLRDRRNITIECKRSGDRKPDIFHYGDWFDALLMPIRIFTDHNASVPKRGIVRVFYKNGVKEQGNIYRGGVCKPVKTVKETNKPTTVQAKPAPVKETVQQPRETGSKAKQTKPAVPPVSAIVLDPAACARVAAGASTLGKEAQKQGAIVADRSKDSSQSKPAPVQPVASLSTSRTAETSQPTGTDRFASVPNLTEKMKARAVKGEKKGLRGAELATFMTGDRRGRRFEALCKVLFGGSLRAVA